MEGKAYCPKCERRLFFPGDSFRGFLDQHINGVHRQCEYSVYETKVRPEIEKIAMADGEYESSEFQRIWS